METSKATSFAPEMRSRLLEAGSYQDFLRAYFQSTGLPYAEVARRGGFSSRSYPRDVTEGRRRLTAKSLASLLRGLRLEGDLSKVFQGLYFQEYPEEHPEALSSAVIAARLVRDRETAAKKKRAPVRVTAKPPEMKRLPDERMLDFAAGLTDVIAAIGEMEAGATLEDIQKRTGVARPILAEKLEAMVRDGVVEYRGDARRYFSRAEHIDWTGQAGNRLAKAMFRSSAERLGQAAEGHFAQADTMFLNSALSIPKSEIPRLKKELRELILKFVDRSVSAEANPDTVVQVVAGLFEGRLAPPRSYEH